MSPVRVHLQPDALRALVADAGGGAEELLLLGAARVAVRSDAAGAALAERDARRVAHAGAGDRGRVGRPPVSRTGRRPAALLLAALLLRVLRVEVVREGLERARRRVSSPRPQLWSQSQTLQCTESTPSTGQSSP